MEVIIKVKDLFKSSVAIGAGLTVGNESMQKFCDKYEIKYKEPENDDSPKDKIFGFHV